MARGAAESRLITVVAINYNGGDLILDCLKALRRQTSQGFSTLVVDNASTDGSVNAIKREFPEVRVLLSNENLGFAGGVNLALREGVDTEWFALLNPDAIPEPGWVAALSNAIRTYPEAAAFGSRMFKANCPGVLDGIGDVYHVSGLVWRRRHGKPERLVDRREGEIFSPCAAAALYRTDAVREVGGMDADLFCYLEDVDLGFRLGLAGFSCRYVPEAVVHHVGSAITGCKSDFQTYYGHRNMIWVFMKNMPLSLLLFLLPVHILMNLVVLMVLVKQGRGQVAWRAKVDALLGLPRVWHKRKEVSQIRRVGVLTLARKFEWVSLFG